MSKQLTNRKPQLTANQLAKLRAVLVWEEVPAPIWSKVCGECLRECSPEVIARIGQRVDMQCLASQRRADGTQFFCGRRRSVWWGDAKPGFHKAGRNGDNVTKRAVLSALVDLGGTATARAIAEEAVMPLSAVTAYLNKARKRSMPYISRSAERVPLAIGSAYTWTMTDRAYDWLVYAGEHGLGVVDGQATA